MTRKEQHLTKPGSGIRKKKSLKAPSIRATYSAVIRKDGRWWVGWIEEVQGVNSQGKTRQELLDNLQSALKEALAMNRADARQAAGQAFEVASISV
jgi:predicted RNase H-like HicB family nuclease